MKISVKQGYVSLAVCSSFHSLATSKPLQALTGPASSRPPPLARIRRGFSQSMKKMSTLHSKQNCQTWQSLTAWTCRSCCRCTVPPRVWNPNLGRMCTLQHRLQCMACCRTLHKEHFFDLLTSLAESPKSAVVGNHLYEGYYMIRR